MLPLGLWRKLGRVAKPKDFPEASNLLWAVP